MTMKKCPRCNYANICGDSMCKCKACGLVMGGGAEGQSEVEKKPEKAVKKKMPSIMKQAANFAKSVTKHVATGAQKVPNHVRASRLEICRACDKLDEKRCTECGCFVDIKAGWASEACPLAKWGPYRHTRGGCNCGRK
tara:strand:- start:415 stop:828 length:414 start_codon:yes stop_codon:yes gene_type:complete